MGAGWGSQSWEHWEGVSQGQTEAGEAPGGASGGPQSVGHGNGLKDGCVNNQCLH